MKKENAEAVVKEENLNAEEAKAEELTPEQKKKKKVNKIVNTVINVILIIAIVFAVICTYIAFVSDSGHGAPGIFGVQLLSIQTDSMMPTLMPGDLIIDIKVKDPSELRPGDIITYWTMINGDRVLNTHRIEQIYDGSGYLIFETKGDNNTIADTLTVHQSEIVGKYQFRIPGVGKAFDYLQTSTGFLIVVVIPVFIFFIFHLVQFFRVLFEYQNVKNRIKFEQERGRTEDILAARELEIEQKNAERAAIEAELREKLRAELLASMAKEQADKPAEPETSPLSEAALTEEKTNESEAE